MLDDTGETSVTGKIIILLFGFIFSMICLIFSPSIVSGLDPDVTFGEVAFSASAGFARDRKARITCHFLGYSIGSRATCSF